jgi:hypothetical protein
MCSLPTGEMEGPYSARFPSSSIGARKPDVRLLVGGLQMSAIRARGPVWSTETT